MIFAAATAATALPVGKLIALLVFGIALLLVLILRLKLQAFLSLIVVSVVVAAVSKFVNPDAVPLTKVAGTIVDSMGGSLGFIATIIGIGAIFGAILEHSGGTQALATSLVRHFGEERAPWAMLLTGFVISIPVFLDVALVMLAPLLYALARDTKRPLLYFGLPLVAGMAVTHAFVPPTPGPVAVGVILGVPLGWVILFGIMVGLPTAIICGPWLCSRFADKFEIPLPEMEAAPEKTNLPDFRFILLLVAVPIVLILSGTIIEQMTATDITRNLKDSEDGRLTLNLGSKEAADSFVASSGGALTEPQVSEGGAVVFSEADPQPDSLKKLRESALSLVLANSAGWKQFGYFLSQPVIALLISTLIALYFLGTRRGVSRETLLEISTKALGPAGIIILITGAGGVFKGVLKATGITEALAQAFGGSGIPVLVLAWIFATLVRIAQGSATVAMLTAAGLMTGFVGGLSNPQLALVTIVIAAGATGFSHVNDSGFWMISRYFGMSEAQTLRSWTIISTAISVVGFLLALLIWRFV